MLSNYTGFVKFSAEWCSPCKAFAPVVKGFSEKYNIELTDVDIDEDPDTASKYGVRSIPTLVSFKDGEPLGIHVGSMTDDQLREFADKSGFIDRSVE